MGKYFCFVFGIFLLLGTSTLYSAPPVTEQNLSSVQFENGSAIKVGDGKWEVMMGNRKTIRRVVRVAPGLIVLAGGGTRVVINLKRGVVVPVSAEGKEYPAKKIISVEGGRDQSAQNDPAPKPPIRPKPPVPQFQPPVRVVNQPRYFVQNQWGGNTAAWNEGGRWTLGGRENQKLVAMQLKSPDNGVTLDGSITYAGEGIINFRGRRVAQNNYAVEVKWGSSTWQKEPNWIIGGRTNQNVVRLNLKSNDGGASLIGTMQYTGEGPIGFFGALSQSARPPLPVQPKPVAQQPLYLVQNRWGGATAPWQPAGDWKLGGRTTQKLVAMSVQSSDNGQNLSGSITYAGEGPINFRGRRIRANTYDVQVRWGSSPWQAEPNWIIGSRSNQSVVRLNVKSPDGGKSLTGTMQYSGEGPIDFRGMIK